MNRSQARVLSWLSWVILFTVGLALPTLLGRSPDFVEAAYARGLFPWIARTLGPIGRLVPFSVAQLVVAAAVVMIVFEIIRVTRSLRHARASAQESNPETRSRPTEVVRQSAHRWLRLVTIVVWLFHLVWGLNYARPPLRERMSLPEIAPTTERLARLTRSLAHETNHAYEQALRFDEATADTIRGTQLQIGNETLWEALSLGFDVVDPRLKGIGFSPPKLPTPAGAALSRLGISGVYFPFTGEASVNSKMPEVSLPFVAAHEMAHQRGIAREDEANALAYLACRQAGRWVTRYSGALSAYRRSLSALWRAEPDSARAVAKLLALGPRHDQIVIREFWQSQKGVASDAAGKVNDTYLKANAQADGVESYGRMVDLLVVLNELDMLQN